jgi:hypothetical protein
MAPSSPLDAYVPRFDVRERFETSVHAPAEVVMDVAEHFDLQSLTLVHGIFRMREWIMGVPGGTRTAAGLRDELTGLGWGVLEERPGALLVCGAVCRPWLPDVRFHSVAPEAFAGYGEPDCVKIAWTLEADAAGPGLTRFSHETRVVATDEDARLKFRRYWRWARVGIISIRLLLMPAVRRQAEARV